MAREPCRSLTTTAHAHRTRRHDALLLDCPTRRRDTASAAACAGSRSGSVNTVAAVAIAVVVIVASVATTVQVYRIGDSGAQAAWGDTAAATTP